MPSEFKFEVVPLAQVPIENALTPSDVTVKDLEALSADDGKNHDPSDVLKRADALEIPGLPRGHKAWITQQPGKHRVVLETRNGDAELLGEYSNLKDAMYALSTKLGTR
jgi:hypothetical protein